MLHIFFIFIITFFYPVCNTASDTNSNPQQFAKEASYLINRINMLNIGLDRNTKATSEQVKPKLSEQASLAQQRNFFVRDAINALPGSVHNDRTAFIQYLKSTVPACFLLTLTALFQEEDSLSKELDAQKRKRSDLNKNRNDVNVNNQRLFAAINEAEQTIPPTDYKQILQKAKDILGLREHAH
ncbi:hypothetical protein HYV10_01805 [Candidatus Dependentiae bacterium]|nr:hypothetical protein [Candidatus Dependentiae bacterium]